MQPMNDLRATCSQVGRACLPALLFTSALNVMQAEVVRLSGSVTSVAPGSITIHHGRHDDPVRITSNTRFHYGIADAQFEEMVPGDLAYIKTTRTAQGLEAEEVRFIGKRKKPAASSRSGTARPGVLSIYATSPRR